MSLRPLSAGCREGQILLEKCRHFLRGRGHVLQAILCGLPQKSGAGLCKPGDEKLQYPHLEGRRKIGSAVRESPAEAAHRPTGISPGRGGLNLWKGTAEPLSSLLVHFFTHSFPISNVIRISSSPAFEIRKDLDRGTSLLNSRFWSSLRIRSSPVKTIANTPVSLSSSNSGVSQS